MNDELVLKPIAVVQGCYPYKFGVPRQSGLVKQAIAKIFVNLEYQPSISLKGLEGFSHCWVIFWFHLNSVGRYHSTVRPPRANGATLGVFSTRSPHRPNPIGLSLLEILSVEKDGLVVSGADLVNGTPILDIKPYLSSVESLPASFEGWTANVVKSNIEVIWTPDQLAELEIWKKKLKLPDYSSLDLKLCIENTLKLDPRPKIYKGFEGETSEKGYRSIHHIRFYDGDIHFHFPTPEKIEILEVLFPGNGMIGPALPD